MKKIKVKNCYWIKLPTIDHKEKGKLTFAEEQKHVPFAIKRIYYIYDVKDLKTKRGGHGHKNLEQTMFCLNGRCDIILNDGKIKQKFELKASDYGIYMGRYVWRVFENFSENCVILVLASDFYKEDDYIRNYEEFKKYVAKHE
jgi:dTDP-4-dehydrorhamnose 3,5-epimerase-like enzyme